MLSNEALVLALPKGRILREVMPLVREAGIEPEPAFDDPNSRLLKFSTNLPELSIIRVRSFDVATFVAFGAAHFGVAGNDVLMEFDYPEIYAPVDLGIGRCRLSVAAPKAMAVGRRSKPLEPHPDRNEVSGITKRHFASRGVQAETIKLNGAMELAPNLGLCRRIVDLVSTGQTLKDNGLVEIETIAEVTSRFVVNRAALKTRPVEVGGWVDRFRGIADAA